jgi:phosphomannomutase
MSFVRSISGIRATLNEGLKPDILSKYVSAYCNSLPPGEIVVGRDGRPSGTWVESLVIASISACGRKVVKIGIAPTPTVQLITEKSDAVGGIAITASHNPGNWNGLKFLNGYGVFLNQEENEKFWDIYESDSVAYTSNQKNELLIKEKDALKLHLDSILNENLFDIKSMQEYFKSTEYKVVVDAVNASGSNYIPALLEQFGCEVVNLYTDNSGIFPHTPEPINENLNDICNSIKVHNANLGIVVDPDADRLVLIDENGNPIGEEKTIALAVKSVLSNIEKYQNNYSNEIVVNLSTSSMVDFIAEEYGAKVSRSAVGEINVVEKMKETNALIGGEGSGGVIFPHVHYGRDSLVGVALVMQLISQNKKALSLLSSELPNLVMIKSKIGVEGNPKIVIEKLIAEFEGFNIDTTDGVRIEFDDRSWVHIRASNTEPIIRIICESQSVEDSQRLKNTFIDKVKELF